jgi:alkylhydroperoxidase/carboxymuconolactone decarboxylase family protein YurZ
MGAFRQDGDKIGLRPVNEDELLAEFREVPTVHASVAATDLDDVRKALLVLVGQALDRGATEDEIADALRAVHPHSWGEAKNRNRVY